MKKIILLPTLLFIFTINILVAQTKKEYIFKTNDLIVTDQYDVASTVEGDIVFTLDNINNTFKSNFKNYIGKISEVTITNNDTGFIFIFVWNYEDDKKMLVKITTHHSDNSITLVAKSVIGINTALISSGKIWLH